MKKKCNKAIGHKSNCSIEQKAEATCWGALRIKNEKPQTKMGPEGASFGDILVILETAAAVHI